MKQLEVQIMGQSYLLGCPDDGDARLLEAVERVDSAMCKIRDSGKIRVRERIAVLAALNLAFDLSDKGATHAVDETLALSTPPQARENNPVLASLIQRLDAALGADGRLI